MVIIPRSKGLKMENLTGKCLHCDSLKINIFGQCSNCGKFPSRIFHENIKFGVDLEELMHRYPHSKVYTALIMAVRNLKRGNPANYLIRSDWDKYGYSYLPDSDREKFSEGLKELCVKYGIMDKNGHFV